MQVNIPEQLRNEVVFHNGVVYYKGKYLLQSSAFLTFRKQVLKTYPNVKFEENAQKVLELIKGQKKEGLEEEIDSFFQFLKTFALENRVSDLHIEVKETTEFYIRKSGLYKHMRDWSKNREFGEALLQAIFYRAHSASHVQYSVADYQYAGISDPTELLPGIEGIRIQKGPMKGGFFAVLRFLFSVSDFELKTGKTFEETFATTLRSYGYSERSIRKIKPVVEAAEGLTIIAGPTGSGKSTALKLFLELLHTLYPTKSIFTIENPPEYNIKGAKQLPVMENQTFADVLRVALRSDPDVIMVGEIREPETAQAAINAVLTGHQVFTTIHAKDVATIFERLGKLGVDTNMLIENELIGLLISQRLVPRNCPHCKVKETVDGLTGYHAKGCAKCNYTGVSGRLVVEEAINFDDLRKIGNVSPERIKYYINEQGISLIHRGIELVKQGELSPIALKAFVGVWQDEHLR